MSDVVVTVPKRLWRDWLDEGDLPGEEWSGLYCSFYCGGFVPVEVATTRTARVSDYWLPPWGGNNELRIAAPDQRVYVVSHGRLRGYSPLFALEVHPGSGRLAAFIRRGDGQALTIDEEIRGFQGWRKRWWPRSAEVGFPGWATEGVTP